MTKLPTTVAARDQSEQLPAIASVWVPAIVGMRTSMLFRFTALTKPAAPWFVVNFGGIL